MLVFLVILILIDLLGMIVILLEGLIGRLSIYIMIILIYFLEVSYYDTDCTN